MDTDSPSPPEFNGARLPSGRFGKHNTFGRGGNPYLRRIHALRSRLYACTTDDDLERIVRKLADLAGEGDVAAARLWLEYALGKAPQALELAGPDGAPLGGSLDMLRAAIFAALGPHPEARVAVAAAIMRLRGDDGPAVETGDRV